LCKHGGEAEPAAQTFEWILEIASLRSQRRLLAMKEIASLRSQ
jgi:hypothetical protein